MGIQFYKCSAEKNRVNKSGYLTPTFGITAYELLDNSNNLNPSFRVETTDTGILKSNYCYWEESNRYYYIKVTALSYGIYMVTGSVDVLYTYRNAIWNSTGICTRGNTQNPWLPDDAIQVQNNRTYEYLSLPGQLEKNLKNILIVAGGE